MGDEEIHVWTMAMPDGSIMEPDLEWFDRQFSPDRPLDKQFFPAVWDFNLDVQEVYGLPPETAEQTLARKELMRLRLRPIRGASIKRRARHIRMLRGVRLAEVKRLRRSHLERAEVYSAANGFGIF